MTKNGANSKQSSGSNLLTNDERAVCEQVANGETPHSQRAQALLAIDAGSTQAAAAKGSGLSLSQVRYCVRRFRQVGLSIFPETAERAPKQSEAKIEKSVKTKPKKKKPKTGKTEKKKKDKKAKKSGKKGKDKQSKKDKVKKSKKDSKKKDKKASKGKKKGKKK